MQATLITLVLWWHGRLPTLITAACILSIIVISAVVLVYTLVRFVFRLAISVGREGGLTLPVTRLVFYCVFSFTELLLFYNTFPVSIDFVMK